MEAENDDIGSPVPAIKYASSVVPDIAKISPTGKYKINDLQEWSSKTNAEKFYILIDKNHCIKTLEFLN